MIRYKLNCKDQLPYHIAVEMTFNAPADIVKVIIPFWRPGRYEGGNFTKNFINLKASSSGVHLKLLKLSSNEMEIYTSEGSEVTLSYHLYSRELTAGNTYIDDELLLINPVNACAYVEGLEEEACQMQFELPENWAISTAMERTGEGVFQARDMQHLMDTPIMAAPNVDVLQYEVDSTKFYVHIIGGFEGNDEELVEDFTNFSKRQIDLFGRIPVDEYHFLLIFLPHRAYHGVEHENSTVIILGPGKDQSERASYLNLLGVSSHELYHTWNIKYIRPADWAPYDFTSADYSRLGYVAEGVTTYMGDLMLWQGGVTSDEEFLKDMASLLKRHRDNEGRYNLSLANSSVDTWVDGYGRGTPRRRVSIYVEGALLALVCDVWLLLSSQGEQSLSSAMRKLFESVSKDYGYSEEDYWSILSEKADKPWEELSDKVLDGTGYLEAYVLDALNLMGIEIHEKPAKSVLESAFGFQLQKVSGKYVVWNLFATSPAEIAGLWFDDEVLTINDMSPSEFLESKHDDISTLDLTVQSGFRQKKIRITRGDQSYGNYPEFRSTNQELFDLWKGIRVDH